MTDDHRTAARRLLFGLDGRPRSRWTRRSRSPSRPSTSTERLLIGVVNAAKVVKLQADPLLRDSLLEADLLLADGQSVVWASRLLRQPAARAGRRHRPVRGAAGLADREDLSVYLLGAKPEVLARVEQEIAAALARCGRSPARGTATSPTTSRPRSRTRSRRAGRTCCSSGMTTPKKEIFLGHVRRRARRPGACTASAARSTCSPASPSGHRAGSAAAWSGPTGCAGAAPAVAALPDHQPSPSSALTGARAGAPPPPRYAPRAALGHPHVSTTHPITQLPTDRRRQHERRHLHRTRRRHRPRLHRPADRRRAGHPRRRGRRRRRQPDDRQGRLARRGALRRARPGRRRSAARSRWAG